MAVAIRRRSWRRSTARRSELRRNALTYEADGQIREAIEAWTALNRLREDAEIEARLVDLRCDPRNVASRLAESHGQPVQPWPRRLDDPFPDVSGRPPEIPAADLSMELLGGAILHHGSLLVRGLLTRDRVEALRTTIARAFDARQRHSQAASTATTTPWYVPSHTWDAADPGANAMRRYSSKGTGLYAVDSPRGLFQFVDALASTNVITVINEYLGEPALLSIHKSMLRRVPPDAKPSFHQDGTFMGMSTRAVDVWVALSECGEGTDAPGLALLPRRLVTSVRPGAAKPQLPLSAEELEAVCAGDSVVSPRCAPGDALLFDELCLHANGGDRPGLRRHRYAIEAWMFAPSAIPAPYLPMLV